MAEDRDTWAHPLWPYEKVRWEELTPGERNAVRLRVLGAQDSAFRTIDETSQLIDYLNRKETEVHA